MPRGDAHPLVQMSRREIRRYRHVILALVKIHMAAETRGPLVRVDTSRENIRRLWPEDRLAKRHGSRRLAAR